MGTLADVLKGKDLDETRELSTPYSAGAEPDHAADDERLPPGTSVEGYLIESVIAAGGGGTVYAARPATPEHPAAAAGPVAIKVLLRELAGSTQALARFQREAEVVQMIDHPNITRVLSSGELPDGRPYIVMELVSPDNLRTLIEQGGRLAPAETLEILEPVCSALAAAHAAGVIHRDLKASNLSVGQEGGRRVIKLLDFGIAKLTQADPSVPGLTVQGSRLGTPYAMAPEQIRGDAVDERADIYALGVLTFHMLTASYPFSALSRQEIERMHLEAIAPPPSRLAPLPAAIDAVIARALHKRPEARYRTVAEFLAAFRAAADRDAAAADTGEHPAVAIYVELEAAASAAADELIEASADAIAAMEGSLRAAGFEIALETANAILGARLLPDDPATAHYLRQQALALAQDLAARPTPSPELTAKVLLHVAPAQVQAGKIAGGPIVRVSDWTPSATHRGVQVTAEALSIP